MDPYRPTRDTPASTARILAGPSRWRTAWHFALLVGLLGVAAWAVTTPFGYRMRVWIGLLAVPVIFDLVRTAHEAMLPHRVTADNRGLELVWAKKAPWRPWMRRRSAAIAWEHLQAVRTSTVSVNGVGTTELMISWALGPTIVIPDGTFSGSAESLQQAILDERDDRIEAPRREAADVAGFCSDRFETPRTLRWRPDRGQRVAATLIGGLMIVGPAWVGFMIGGTAHLLLTLPGVLLGAFLLYLGWSASSPRVLRLQAEGLAHGPAEDRLTLVRWSEIRFARPTVVNGVTVRVRVAVKAGPDVALSGNYGVGLGELAAMITPPLSVVLRARAQPPSAEPAAPPSP